MTLRHGLGTDKRLGPNVQHLVSPIVGMMRLMLKDGEMPDRETLEQWVDRLEHALEVASEFPAGYTTTEYGVETRKAYDNFEPRTEWGASVGMTHRYEYTEKTVLGLAGGNPIYKRTRTVTPDVIGEPELVKPGEL